MQETDRAIATVITTAVTMGRTRSGRRSYTRWAAAEPLLSAWSSAGDLVTAGRAAPPGEQDRIIGCLLRQPPADELAQITLLAVLSRALGSVITAWGRAGADSRELRDLEADLVSGCWLAANELGCRIAAGDAVPPRVALLLRDRARQSVRTPRRRQLRTAQRQESLSAACAAVAPDRPACERLAGEIADAVRGQLLTAAEAAPVFLTRVVGYDVVETARRLGTTPATVRASRSRSERRLSAAVA